jgi:hypothetical protein
MSSKGSHKVPWWFPEWASRSKLISSTLSSLELSSFVGVSALPSLIRYTMLARHWLNNNTSSVDSWRSPAPSSHLPSKSIREDSCLVHNCVPFHSHHQDHLHQFTVDVLPPRAQRYLVPTTPHRASSLLRKSHIHPTTTHIGASSNRFTHSEVCYVFHLCSRTQSMLLLALLTATYCLLIDVHNFILTFPRKSPCRIRANRR